MHYQNYYLKLICKICSISLILFIISCEKSKDDTNKIDVGKGFLTVLPLDTADFYLFVNLGHVNQPGHTFPSDHGGFYLNNYMTPKYIYCPADMTITRLVASEHVGAGYTDYGMTLSVNDGEFQIVLGHKSSINQEILDEAGEFSNDDCETYSTGGGTFKNCILWTNIDIYAGDTLGMAGGNPGQYGLDFGTFDKTKTIEFASNRYDDYLYPHTVSPLDYFTDSITQILTPVCGDYYCGVPTIRTTPPIGGTVDYDIVGSAQGLWYKVGEPTHPEDPHIALIYSNAKPEDPLFSVGTSIPDLNTGSYTFIPVETGYENRRFDGVSADGKIYKYDVRRPCEHPSINYATILIQLVDSEHLKVEKQATDIYPPWEFTSNAVMFER